MAKLEHSTKTIDALVRKLSKKIPLGLEHTGEKELIIALACLNQPAIKPTVQAVFTDLYVGFGNNKSKLARYLGIDRRRLGEFFEENKIPSLRKPTGRVLRQLYDPDWEKDILADIHQYWEKNKPERDFTTHYIWMHEDQTKKRIGKNAIQRIRKNYGHLNNFIKKYCSEKVKKSFIVKQIKTPNKKDELKLAKSFIEQLIEEKTPCTYTNLTNAFGEQFTKHYQRVWNKRNKFGHNNYGDFLSSDLRKHYGKK